MRADRLLTILLSLQVYGRITARELATRLEVSERTIYRDMEALGAAGIPVVAERGTNGGWMLLEEYRTNLTGLNEAEIQTLFLGRPPNLLRDLGLGNASEGALVKLLAALPSANRRGAEYLRQRIHIDAAGWGRYEEDIAHLGTIQEAIWSEYKLRFAYQRGDGTETEREASPLGLVAKGSVWYLVALVDDEIRTYRISRISHATITNQPATRPPDFDLVAYWNNSTADFIANLPRYEAILRATPETIKWMRIFWRYATVQQVDPPDENGWSRLNVQFQTEKEASEYILSMGANIEILDPPDLRERVIAAAQALLHFYAEQSPDIKHAPSYTMSK